MTLRYSDELTATFVCTAFGGENTQLVFTWNPSTKFDQAPLQPTENADKSTTSTITTLPLSLRDREGVCTCQVRFMNTLAFAEASATLSIGEVTYFIYNYDFKLCVNCSTSNS